MADEKPNQTPEPEDENFWDLESQGVDDIISEAAEPSFPSSPATASNSPEPSPALGEEASEPGAEEPQEPSPTSKPKDPASRVERSFQITILLLLIALGTWFYTYLLNHFDTEDKREYLANTPAFGEFASIESIDSWWQEPSGSKTLLGIKLVPAAEIHLSPSSTGSGTLRVVFYSAEKNSDGSPKSVGDSITISFENGKFTNGSSSFKVLGTVGLEDMGDFYAYRNQDEERWTVEVREASAESARIRDFKDLAKAPIEPIVKEIVD